MGVDSPSTKRTRPEPSSEASEAADSAAGPTKLARTASSSTLTQETQELEVKDESWNEEVSSAGQAEHSAADEDSSSLTASDEEAADVSQADAKSAGEEGTESSSSEPSEDEASSQIAEEKEGGKAGSCSLATNTVPATPATEGPKPKFIFGSAAKSMVSFTSLAKSDSKTDWSVSTAEPSGKAEDGKGMALSKPSESTLTGEENEKTKFSGRAKLFEFDAGSREWRERGIGSVKVNEDQITGDARLLMRAEGVLRVLVNVRLFQGMQFVGVPDRSVRFVAVVDGKPAQYLLRLKSNDDANALLMELSIYCQSEADEFE